MSWDRFVEIVKIFIPKAHNKFTWALIIIGSGLMSNKWWLPLVYSLFDKAFETDVSKMVSIEPLYGLLLILSALIYHCVSEIILQQQGEKGSHPSDIKLAQELLKLLSDHNLFFLNNQNFGNTFSATKIRFIEHVCYLIEDASSEFENGEMQECLQALYKDFNLLDEKIGVAVRPTTQDASRFTVYTVQEELAYELTKKTLELIKELNKLSKIAYNQAINFIRSARKLIPEAFE